MAFAEPADRAVPAVAVDEDVGRDAAEVVGVVVVGIGVVVVVASVVVLAVVASVALQSTEVAEVAPAVAVVASVVVASVVEMLAAAVPVWEATARPIPRVAKTPTLATAAPTRDRAAG